MFRTWKSVVVAVAGLVLLAGIAEGARRIDRDGVLFAGHDGVDQQIAKIDSTGAILTNTQGPAADDAAATGAPVLVGCKYLATPNTVEDGDASFVSCDARTNQTVALRSNAADNLFTSTPTDDSTNAYSAYVFNSREFNFDGTTWDREFSCGSTAVVNVAAAATTELVALTASSIVRVCSMVLTADTAATTATFVYGTGSNCATGQVALTGAMRFVDEGNISLSAGNGSLFRGIASNAICLTAATGAVSGFITYAKY